MRPPQLPSAPRAPRPATLQPPAPRRATAHVAGLDGRKQRPDDHAAAPPDAGDAAEAHAAVARRAAADEALVADAL
jgi:hypothetical protein